MDNRLYSIKETCARLGISTVTLLRLRRLQKIRPTKTRVLRRVQFSEREIERYIADNTRVEK
jgi:predicted site-specific integrase-resolvase